MYKLHFDGEISKNSILVAEKVAGKNVFVRAVDTSQPQVRRGPDFKPKKEKPNKDKGK